MGSSTVWSDRLEARDGMGGREGGQGGERVGRVDVRESRGMIQSGSETRRWRRGREGRISCEERNNSVSLNESLDDKFVNSEIVPYCISSDHLFM